MYMISRSIGEEQAKANAVREQPAGPGLTKEQAKDVFVVEVWGSSFDDPGPDYCVFKCKDAAGKIIHEVRVEGY